MSMRHTGRLVTCVSVLVGLVALTSPRTAAAGMVRKGDRIVFLGDSITAANAYTRDVETFLRLRHPDDGLSFFNVGIGGHSALEGRRRLDHDVLRYNPTLVLVNFGMNDAGYAAGTKASRFDVHMGAILDALAARKVRVVWLEPTPVDTRGLTAQAPAARRAANLERFVQYVRSEGARRGIPVVPLFDALREAISFDGPQDRLGKLIPDRIHPSSGGHALVAAAILRALGEELEPPMVKLAWQGGMLASAMSGRSLKAVEWDGKSRVRVELTGLLAPVPMMPEKSNAGGEWAEVARRVGRLELRAEGLDPATSYTLSLGAASWVRTGAELARGVDLMAGSSGLGRRQGGSADARCGRTDGHPFMDDAACVRGLAEGRDAILMQSRSDRHRPMPSFPAGRKAEMSAFIADWYDAYAAYMDERVRKARGVRRVLTLEQRAPARIKGAGRGARR
jgi:lysophospholipase L1-like esterase